MSGLTSTWALWAVAALLCVWQSVLTWVVLRTREDRDPEGHRMARVATAMSELVDRFEDSAGYALDTLEARRREPELPRGLAARNVTPPACPSCEGTGIAPVASSSGEHAYRADRAERRARAVGGTSWDRPSPVFGNFRR